MKTYNLDIRHAQSKRRLNALADNRLEPLKRRLASDPEAIAWAQGELLDFARRARGANLGRRRRLVDIAPRRWACPLFTHTATDRERVSV